MPLILALRKWRQENLCEFEASLVYKVSFGTGPKTTYRNPVSKNKTKQKKEDREGKFVDLGTDLRHHMATSWQDKVHFLYRSQS